MFMKSKMKLREWAKTQRISEKTNEKNATILKKIKEINVFSSAKNVMLFYPLKYEVDLIGLLELSKHYSFPCIENNEIIPYLNNGDFIVGQFNIKEPVKLKKQPIEDIDLVIVPALCVDKNGNRVGYGKGYYDRFIKKLDRNRTKIMVAILDKFLVEDIEVNEFDEKIDFIVTEKRVIQI